MQVFNDELHCGSDFIRRYVAEGHDFTGATAVMKVRAENDIELVAADCDGSTWDNGVGVSYSKQDRL